MADEDIKQGEFVIEYVGEGDILFCFAVLVVLSIITVLFI